MTSVSFSLDLPLSPSRSSQWIKYLLFWLQVSLFYCTSFVVDLFFTLVQILNLEIYRFKKIILISQIYQIIFTRFRGIFVTLFSFISLVLENRQRLFPISHCYLKIDSEWSKGQIHHYRWRFIPLPSTVYRSWVMSKWRLRQ